MIENMVDFVVSAGAGVIALLCLFEGARRIGVHGMHRKAVLMVVLSAGVCALYGGFAHQKYVDMRTTLLTGQRRAAPVQAATAWTRVTSREKRETLTLALARQTFKESGTLGAYIDRNGQTRTFAPTQEDLVARERVLAYYSRTEAAARGSLAESLVWLIAGVIALLLGLAMSLDRPPAKSTPDDAPASA
jgi:hypothetical protein